jgi:hypothetical protein
MSTPASQNGTSRNPNATTRPALRQEQRPDPPQPQAESNNTKKRSWVSTYYDYHLDDLKDSKGGFLAPPQCLSDTLSTEGNTAQPPHKKQILMEPRTYHGHFNFNLLPT